MREIAKSQGTWARITSPRVYPGYPGLNRTKIKNAWDVFARNRRGMRI